MIYLSGKISDETKAKEDANILRFHRKAAELRNLGLEVHNPVEGELHGQSWEYLLAGDLDAIYRGGVTGIYLMKGWQDSKGARLERQACLRLQIENPDFLIVEEQ